MRPSATLFLTLMLALPVARADGIRCVVAKKRFVQVTLLERSPDGRGEITRESVSLHEDGRPAMTIRVRAKPGEAWMIPSRCMSEMRQRLDARDVDRVLDALAVK